MKLWWIYAGCMTASLAASIAAALIGVAGAGPGFGLGAVLFAVFTFLAED